MDLLFLYGPAAVGKLTVGQELSRLTGYRLFHNHLVVDALTPVFDFGSGAFVRLRELIWLSVFREAAREGVSLIFTFTPERTVRESFVEEATAAVEPAGGRVLLVELTCPLEELERRIESESRARFGKLRSLEVFRQLRREGAFDVPRLPAPSLTIDTNARTPREAAVAISRHLGIAR